jgi:hypothetical protein
MAQLTHVGEGEATGSQQPAYFQVAVGMTLSAVAKDSVSSLTFQLEAMFGFQETWG